MAFPIWLLAVAAFLSGGVAAVFVMLVIGIHMGDRARDLSDAPRKPLDAHPLHAGRWPAFWLPGRS